MTIRSADIVIVGAGPAGMVLATGLAKLGVDFIILDALDEIPNTSRAAVIHARTLETLDTLGLAKPLQERGIRVKRFCIRDRDRILLRADFSALPGDIHYALMIPQDETEHVLAATLAQLGHAIQRPVTVERVENMARGARVHFSSTAGPGVIDCKYVVGADGQNSVVRKSAGIAYPGSTYGSFLLADVYMDWPISNEEVSLFFSADGTLVVAPMSRERYRVVAQLVNAPSVPDLCDVQAVLDSRGPENGVETTGMIWGSRFQVHHKLAEVFCKGSVVLAGDAAHCHSPAGGQGMNLGIRDAAALAVALREAIAGGSNRRLEVYAKNRREEAKRVLAMTDRLTKMATLNSRLARHARNTVIRMASRVPAVRRRVARTLAGY